MPLKRTHQSVHLNVNELIIFFIFFFEFSKLAVGFWAVHFTLWDLVSSFIKWEKTQNSLQFQTTIPSGILSCELVFIRRRRGGERWYWAYGRETQNTWHPSGNVQCLGGAQAFAGTWMRVDAKIEALHPSWGKQNPPGERSKVHFPGFLLVILSLWWRGSK